MKKKDEKVPTIEDLPVDGHWNSLPQYIYDRCKRLAELSVGHSGGVSVKVGESRCVIEASGGEVKMRLLHSEENNTISTKNLNFDQSRHVMQRVNETEWDHWKFNLLEWDQAMEVAITQMSILKTKQPLPESLEECLDAVCEWWAERIREKAPMNNGDKDPTRVVVLDFFIDKIRESNPVTEEMISLFKTALRQHILCGHDEIYAQTTVYLDRPKKVTYGFYCFPPMKFDEEKDGHFGSGGRHLGCDYHPSWPLSEAAKIAGINEAFFPWKTGMWINWPCCVSVKLGYGAAVQWIWGGENCESKKKEDAWNAMTEEEKEAVREAQRKEWKEEEERWRAAQEAKKARGEVKEPEVKVPYLEMLKCEPPPPEKPKNIRELAKAAKESGEVTKIAKEEYGIDLEVKS